MVTLLFRARTIGYICQRIANQSNGKIQAISDRTHPAQIEGTVIRWDSKFPVEAERTINSAAAVSLSRNKKASRVLMRGLTPITWTSWLRERNLFTYPCLVRARRHYAAKGFAVCNNLREVEVALKRFGYQHWYISPIIKKKLEYRVFVFEGTILKVVRRYHDDPTQVAWNIANDGKSSRLKYPSWPLNVCKHALAAADKLGIGWGAVDVIVDDDNKPFVLEINTAPGLTRAETITNLAKVFTAPPAPRPDYMAQTEWKGLIHPSLRNTKANRDAGALDSEDEDE